VVRVKVVDWKNYGENVSLNPERLAETDLYSHYFRGSETKKTPRVSCRQLTI
jgi:hypothetical protein